MPEEAVVTEEIRQVIGVESAPVVFEIEKGWLKRFADAIDDPNPLWQDERHARKTRYGTIVAPPTFVAALRDFGWLEGLMKLKCPLKRVLAGKNDIEFYGPIRQGDTIIVTHKLTDAKEQQGKSGKMLELQYEVIYKNQLGDTVARLRNSLMRY